MKSQDILVALFLCIEEPATIYADKAARLGMSASEVHAAERRLSEARLLDFETKRAKRDARARERKIAEQKLANILKHHAAA